MEIYRQHFLVAMIRNELYFIQTELSFSSNRFKIVFIARQLLSLRIRSRASEYDALAMLIKIAFVRMEQNNRFDKSVFSF